MRMPCRYPTRARQLSAAHSARREPARAGQGDAICGAHLLGQDYREGAVLLPDGDAELPAPPRRAAQARELPRDRAPPRAQEARVRRGTLPLLRRSSPSSGAVPRRLRRRRRRRTPKRSAWRRRRLVRWRRHVQDTSTTCPRHVLRRRLTRWRRHVRRPASSCRRRRRRSPPRRT